MISGYGKAGPGTSFFHTKVENQARTGQTGEIFQRLPFGFTILKSGPPSCAGIRKEKNKGDSLRLIKMFSISDANLPETKPARRMRLSYGGE